MLFWNTAVSLRVRFEYLWHAYPIVLFLFYSNRDKVVERLVCNPLMYYLGGHGSLRTRLVVGKKFSLFFMFFVTLTRVVVARQAFISEASLVSSRVVRGSRPRYSGSVGLGSFSRAAFSSSSSSSDKHALKGVAVTAGGGA